MLMILHLVSVQVLEANLMKGGVELLETRPDQLTRNDIGGEQVLVEQALSDMLLVAVSFLVLTFNELWSAPLLCHCTSFVPKPQAVTMSQRGASNESKRRQ